MTGVHGDTASKWEGDLAVVLSVSIELPQRSATKHTFHNKGSKGLMQTFVRFCDLLRIDNGNKNNILGNGKLD